MRVKPAPTPRRAPKISIAFAALVFAGAVSGCFALFSLDGYGPPGDIVEDAGIDAYADARDSSPAADAGFTGHRIFITDVTFKGDLGGIDGGDGKCQAIAADAGLTGKYVAWLSDSSSDAISRLSLDAGPLRLSTGVLVAETVAELARTGPRTSIIVDERGKSYVPGDCDGGLAVWTGTLADGGALRPYVDCGRWSTSASSDAGVTGLVGGVGTTWSVGCQRTCDVPAALLCIEH